MNSQPFRRSDRSAVSPFAALLAALLAAPALILPSTAQATEDTPTVSVQKAAENAPAAVAARTVFAIGDRLRITFFERYGQALDSSEGQILSSLVERTELTGDYVVQSDGLVFLPLLGPNLAASISSTQLEEALRASFQREFQGEVSVAIQLIEREPVYVAGDIAQPGNFRYVPGMTVMHALALAGASDRVGTDQWRQLDLTRERERLQQSESRLTGIVARSIALARSTGRDEQGLMQHLQTLAGGPTAEKLSAEAIALRDLEMAVIDAEAEAREMVLASLADERTIMEQSIRDAEAAMLDRAARVDLLMDLRQRGATTDQNVHVARTDLATARSVWNELRAAMARLERSVAEVTAQARQSEIAADAAVARELHLLGASRIQEETTRSIMAQALINLGSVATTQLANAKNEMQFEIVRRTPQGLEHIEANSFTEMHPGDMLHIHTRREEHQTAGL